MLVSDFAFEELANQHIVQFYEVDETVLAQNVVRYLADGYRQGSTLVVIATEAHRGMFLTGLEHLGIDVAAAGRTRQLIGLDADTTLRRLLRDGYPDQDLFESTVGSVVNEGLVRAGGRGLRAYGEMVALLWAASQCPAAIRLEQLWENLKKRLEFGLFCSYRIDIFAKEFQPGLVDALLSSHSQLLPTGRNERLANAISQAMERVLGPAEASKALTFTNKNLPRWALLPSGEAMILWLRKMVPARADEVLSLAREYYGP